MDVFLGHTRNQDRVNSSFVREDGKEGFPLLPLLGLWKSFRMVPLVSSFEGLSKGRLVISRHIASGLMLTIFMSFF